MDKKCFIIMPTGDSDGYAQGHFDRIYQYIIVPACRQAGFSAIRADDPAATSNTWEIVKNIIECDIAICDLSSKNSNVIYGLAIRQGINLPVTLIKDLKTHLMFSVQEFSMVEYDESLRIDTVQKEIEALSETLTKTFENRVVINTLLNRFDIGSAQVAETQNIPAEPEPSQEEIKKEESRLPVISPLPDYVGDTITEQEEIDKLKTGDFVFHRNYGKGEIKSTSKMAKDKMAKIQFESGSKLLILGTSGIFRKII